MRHGMSGTKLYKSWAAMKRRCDFPDALHKKYYSDKGIKYCKEWKDFPAFMEWALANGYVEGHTIERIDNSKGYYPENCRWIPAKDQALNKTSSHLITINNETKTISQWCNEYDIKWTTLYARIKRGLTGDALLQKVR